MPTRHARVEVARKPDTRKKLLEAGLELLSEPSLSSITIDQFVNRAKVAKGSFYNHFNSREEFETQVFQQARARMVVHLRKASGDAQDAAVRLARSVCGTISFAIAAPAEARILLRWIYNDQSASENITESVLADVRAGVLDGRFSVPSVAAGALVTFGVGRALLLQALSLGNEPSMLTLAQETTFLLLRSMGIAAEESMSIATQTAEWLLRSEDERTSAGHEQSSPLTIVPESGTG